MKFILLYGAPAVGKLTVAQKLAEISDIQVFDNHQVTDVIEPLVTRAYPEFTKFVHRVQLDIIEATVKANQKIL